MKLLLNDAKANKKTLTKKCGGGYDLYVNNHYGGEK